MIVSLISNKGVIMFMDSVLLNSLRFFGFIYGGRVFIIGKICIMD